MDVARSPTGAVKPREINTRRLLLRPLVADDAPGMYAIYSDPQTMRYWSSRPIDDLEQAARMVSEDLQLQLEERPRSGPSCCRRPAA